MTGIGKSRRPPPFRQSVPGRAAPSIDWIGPIEPVRRPREAGRPDQARGSRGTAPENEKRPGEPRPFERRVEGDLRCGRLTCPLP